MKTFIKYPATSSENIEWGIFLNSTGSITVPPQSEYPIKNHPADYYFTWEQGRKLKEYQMIYIVQGSGTFQNNNGTYNVREGSLMIVHPDCWHRYKPNYQTGWTEYYIGFNGAGVDLFMRHRLFSEAQPVIHVGEREVMADIFLNIFELAEKEQPGYQFIAAGYIVKLLGHLIAFDKRRDFTGKRIAEIIEEARFEMRNRVSDNFNPEEFAEKNTIGYSWFRRMFKNYTGLSPHQYYLQLKIIRAKGLLRTSNLTIKEISYECGFESIHYFSRLFKQKTGLTPGEYRS